MMQSGSLNPLASVSPHEARAASCKPLEGKMTPGPWTLVEMLLLAGVNRLISDHKDCQCASEFEAVARLKHIRKELGYIRLLLHRADMEKTDGRYDNGPTGAIQNPIQDGDDGS